MTTTKSVILKIVALLLAVILGFSMCVGSIVMAGYVVYSKLSYDMLAKLGLVPQDTSSLLDPEAEVSLTAMTIQGLIEEIGELSALGEAVTINMLRERYGLKLTEEQLLMIPSGLRDVPLAKLFAEGGLNVLFENIELNYILQFIPADALAEPARQQLRDKTVKDVIAADLGYLLDGVHLGHVLGVTYSKTSEGVYIPVYADPENPTLFELLAPIDLGNLLGVLTQGGDVLAVFHRHIGDVMISQLFASAVAAGGPLANLLEGKSVADIIKQGEDGVFVFDAWALLNGERMGTVLGFEPIYANAEPTISTEVPEVPEELIIVGWRDGDGNEVYGLNRGLAFATLDGLQAGFNMDDMLSEVYFGDLLEYKPIYDNETGEILSWTKQDGTPVDSMYEGMAPKKLQEAFGGEDGQGGLAMDTLFDGVFLGDVLGYTADYDGETEGIQSTRPEVAEIPEPAAWYDVTTDEGSGVSTEAKVTGLDATLANIPLGKLMDKESNYQISDAFDETSVGDLMGYSKDKDGVWYEYKGDAETAPEFDPEKPDVNKANGYEAVSGVDKAIANISIGKMLDSEEEYQIESEFNDIALGELLGYHYVESVVDGEEVKTWYEYKGGLSGADIPAFDPENPTANDYALVTGVNATFADYDLGKIMSGEQEINTDEMAISEVLALTSKEYTAYYMNELGVRTPMTDANGEPVTLTVWFDKNGEQVDAVIGAIASLNVGNINAALGDTRIGQVIGYYSVERSTGTDGDTELVWYRGEIEYTNDASKNETGAILLYDAEGIMLAMAGLTVNDMSDNDKVTGAIQKVEIGEAMGYVKNGDVWCEKDDEGNLIPLTGVMEKIAGKTIGELDNSVIDEMYIHEIMGYEKNADGKWCQKDGEGNLTQVTGIMAAIADYTVGGLDDENGLDTLLIGKVIGWEHEDNGTPENPSDDFWTDPETDKAAEGIMTHFADLAVNDLSDNDAMTNAIKSVSIAEAMGYKKDGEIWYEADGQTELTGIMAAIADMTVGELGKSDGGINNIYVGEAMDYHYVESVVDGNTVKTWYEYKGGLTGADIPAFDPNDPEKNVDNGYVPASGMMSAFAGLTIGELKNSDAVTGAIQKVKVGEAMGYVEEDGKWYEYKKDEDGKYVLDEDGNRVLVLLTGIMKVIADSNIADLKTKLDETKIGDILGYVHDDNKTPEDPSDDWWYDGETKTTPLVNKMSSSTIGTIGKDMNSLTVGDIFTEEELKAEGSFLQLLSPTTEITKLGTAVNDAFKTTSIGWYVQTGIIQIDNAENLNVTLPGWSELTIQQFLNALANPTSGTSNE